MFSRKKLMFSKIPLGAIAHGYQVTFKTYMYLALCLKFILNLSLCDDEAACASDYDIPVE